MLCKEIFYLVDLRLLLLMYLMVILQYPWKQPKHYDDLFSLNPQIDLESEYTEHVREITVWPTVFLNVG
jgi:hypothetical protein